VLLPLGLFSAYAMMFAARTCVIDSHTTALRLYSRSGTSDLALPVVVTDAEFEAWFERPQPPTTTECSTLSFSNTTTKVG